MRRPTRVPRSLVLPMLVGGVLLAACASPPVLNTQSVNSKVIPESAGATPAPYQGKVVQWGGKIIAVDNLREFTQIQVLAYPLNSRGVPRTGARPQGRFLLRHPGLLDPLDFRPGRWMTTVGTIAGTEHIQIGQARTRIPVILDQQIKLWRHEPERPRVVPHFGIGVGIGL